MSGKKPANSGLTAGLLKEKLMKKKHDEEVGTMEDKNKTKLVYSLVLE